MIEADTAAPPSIQALVELVVQLHAEGSFIRDPSPNVLDVDGSGRPQVADADLEKRSHADIPHLSLGQLWALMHGSGTGEKLEAARLYLERRGMRADIDGALRRFTENRLERCFHENRDFKIVRAGDLRWHVRRELLRDAHMVVLDDPDRFLIPGSKLIKDASTTTVAMAPGDALLKRFNLKKYRSLVKHHFAHSRARSAFQRAYHLELCGIPTPRPIAFAERRILGWLYRSYILTEYLPNALEVDQAFREWSWCAAGAKPVVLAQVGQLIGQLHEAGFANRDLKARNVMVGRGGQAWIIDLDGVRYGERVNEETRIKNLRRMMRDLRPFSGLSIRDRMVFLKAYTRALRNGTAAHLFRKLGQDPW